MDVSGGLRVDTGSSADNSYGGKLNVCIFFFLLVRMLHFEKNNNLKADFNMVRAKRL